MFSNEIILKRITDTKIIPVIKIENVGDTLPLLKALQDGGIGIAEITYRTDCAKEAIKMAIAEYPTMIIGAGTIINLKQVEEAIRLGVHFVVSPGFDENVAKYCVEKGVLYFGGCVTPTEIMKAITMGMEIIKYFPAESFGGLKSIKALSAPFPQVKFMPTGGINIGNIREYLSFEKVVACGGSWMVKDELIKNGDFAKITELSRQAILEVNK